jgi:hypothetical protein
MKFCLSSSWLNTILKSSAHGGDSDLHVVKAAIYHLGCATAVDSRTRRMGYKMFSKERNKLYCKIRRHIMYFPFLLSDEMKFATFKKDEI